MKRFLVIVIMVFVAINFASSSFADITSTKDFFTTDLGRSIEQLDISEKNIVAMAKSEAIDEGGPGEIITSISAHIPAKSEERTRYGLVSFYVVTVDISVKDDTDYKYIYCVSTGETDKTRFYKFDKYFAADANLNDQMKGYQNHLAQFITAAKEKEYLTSAVSKLAAL